MTEIWSLFVSVYCAPQYNMVVPEYGLRLSPFIVTIRNRRLFQNMVSVYCDMETIDYGLCVTINGDHKNLSLLCFAVAQFRDHFYHINVG